MVDGGTQSSFLGAADWPRYATGIIISTSVCCCCAWVLLYPKRMQMRPPSSSSSSDSLFLLDKWRRNRQINNGSKDKSFSFVFLLILLDGRQRAVIATAFRARMCRATRATIASPSDTLLRDKIDPHSSAGRRPTKIRFDFSRSHFSAGWAFWEITVCACWTIEKQRREIADIWIITPQHGVPLAMEGEKNIWGVPNRTVWIFKSRGCCGFLPLGRFYASQVQTNNRRRRCSSDNKTGDKNERITIITFYQIWTGRNSRLSCFFLWVDC